MGSNSSKPGNETSVSIVMQKADADVCDNPDPRSPTPEVSRTPLHSKSGSKHNITKNMDLRKTFENGNEDNIILNNPILSAVIKNHLQSYDPRSPAQDFERTPIVIASKMDNGQEKRVTSEDCSGLHLPNDMDDYSDNFSKTNEPSPDLIIPKNLCNGFFDMSLNESLKDTSSPLGSSTAANEAIESNISNGYIEDKPTILLETNFEYVAAEQSDKPPQILHNKKSAVKVLEIDPRSPSVGIERTPIVFSKILVDNSKDNVEEMSDDSLIKVLQNNNAEPHQLMPEEKNNEHLIYEDEQQKTPNLNDTPKNSKSIYNGGSRTPLSCVKNKDAVYTRSKSANTLYDPKKTKRVSHIPRLTSLNKQTNLITNSSVSLKNISKPSSVSGDCENTPPHSHRDRWDKESSIVL